MRAVNCSPVSTSFLQGSQDFWRSHTAENTVQLKDRILKGFKYRVSLVEVRGHLRWRGRAVAKSHSHQVPPAPPGGAAPHRDCGLAVAGRVGAESEPTPPLWGKTRHVDKEGRHATPFFPGTVLLVSVDKIGIIVLGPKNIISKGKFPKGIKSFSS